MSNKIIIRQAYLDKIKPFIGTNLIKVFVGQRRVGKSYLLRMTAEHIKTLYPNANVIFIDKELYDFDAIFDYNTLIKYIDRSYIEGIENFVFIDEIQEIDSFEKALRHFQNLNKLEIYCSGSNAQLLSGDLATLLSGRYLKIDVSTLSYLEFLEFNGFTNSDEALINYLKWGGLPFIRNLQHTDEVVFDYLRNIISTIIYKDIIYRYKIRNVAFFDSLIHFLAANTGNLITAQKISIYLKSQKVDISTKVVLNYLDNIQNAFLLHKLKRIDVNSKKVFEINHKYYFEDWGLRNGLLGLTHFSVPDVLENVVFAHLKQLGYSVSIGVLKDLEIDFIAEKSGELLYVQVAYLITDAKVKEREFGNLLRINDNFKKIVISMDPYIISDYKGIKHLHLRAFLTTQSF